MSLQGFNVTLQEESPIFSYSPQRDSLPSEGWNASYTNSTIYTVGGYGSGVAYRSSTYKGATVTLSFEGIGLYLCFRTSSSYTLAVDGVAIIKTASPRDDACANYDDGLATLAVADQLAYGSHEAVLTTDQSGTAFWFYGGVVTLSVGIGGTTVQPRDIDDADPAWSYVPSALETAGGWWRDYSNDSDPQEQFFDGGHTWCCTYDQLSTAAYAVNGASALQLYGMVTSNTYGYSVSFNGSETSYNATNLWNSSKQVLFFRGGLDPHHTYPITITDYDPSYPDIPSYYPSGKQFCLNIDVILVQKGTATIVSPSGSVPNSAISSATSSPISSATSSPLSSATSSLLSSATSSPLSVATNPSSVSLGAIIGGAVGPVVLILGVIFGVMCWRRKSRKARILRTDPLDELAVLATPYHNRSPSPHTASPPTSTSTINDMVGASRSGTYFPPMTQVQSVPQASSPPPMSRGQAVAAASTAELVPILDSRVRAEQTELADNVDAPPIYQKHETNRLKDKNRLARRC